MREVRGLDILLWLTVDETQILASGASVDCLKKDGEYLFLEVL